MADRGVDVSALCKEVRDQLAELDLELSEGKPRRTHGGVFQGARLFGAVTVTVTVSRDSGRGACLHVEPQTETGGGLSRVWRLTLGAAAVIRPRLQ